MNRNGDGLIGFVRAKLSFAGLLSFRSYLLRLGIFVASLPLIIQLAYAQLVPMSKDAEAATRASQADVYKRLPFADRRDFDDARWGWIAELPDGHIVNDKQSTVWSMKPYSFLSGEAPATVHPSLWRQAQLNAIHGLFKVTDRMYQVRGLDISNMTIIEGDKTLLIIDPLLTVESARAALNLYYKHRPQKPVGTVIYTHSHADHYGGVKGVISPDDVASKRVQIIAPAGFMETTIAENILAGNAMSRRAQYQFGFFLPPGPRGAVDVGLGKALARGTISLIPPTLSIKQDGEKHRIDGIDIIFQLAPGSEAPAEMMMFFPQLRVLNMAENVTHNMHNLYTIRGAEVRDGNLWSRYINDSIERFGSQTEVLIAQHHWSVRGTERVLDLLRKHRDLYKFINDQSLRLLNRGLTPQDIANNLRLPASLENEWSARGYYGTLSHNAKAVYQKYLGWYDANPANLNPLPPVESARKAVEYMGGAEAAIARAKLDFAKGEYRWVASVMNQVVFADPSNREARELGASALEQLGYQSEAATWRSAYLVGAMELRMGVPKIPPSTLTLDAVEAMSLDLFFDFLGVRLNAEKAEGKKIILNWYFTDREEKWVLNLDNSALTYVSGKQAKDANATLSLTRTVLNDIILQKVSFPDALAKGLIKVDGDPRSLVGLLSMLDTFHPGFAIVEPLSVTP